MTRSCIGSGYCCWKAPCHLAQKEHGPIPGPCPELRWNGERHLCGAVLAAKEKECLMKELFIGEGCCSPLNSWRREKLQNRTNFVQK